tara:strand:- start:25 stop:222 length:198 start_codon:yes stop_codon:yes gene_type:complete
MITYNGCRIVKIIKCSNLKSSFNFDIYLDIKIISGIDLNSKGINHTIEFVMIKLNIEITHIIFAI